jgi:superfamily I DNA/RNA helicase
MSIFKGLNIQQEEAVKAPFDRHCLILAGAGCGKTTVLTRRIAWCAETYCGQKDILALTFTHKAAQEMRDRVNALESIRRDEPLPGVTTFHGFGLGILRDTIDGVSNAARLGYSSEPKLISSAERLEILASVCSREERAALEADILKLDSMLACREAESAGKQGLSGRRLEIMTDLASRYEEKKLELNVWEFSDMISQAIDLLSRFPDVRNFYASRFRHILIDEFQDTSPLQIHLLDALLGFKAHIFAVGDDDQAIYAFRGADIGPTINFTSKFDNSCVLKLEINYRSRPAILTCANKIFFDKPAQYRKVLKSGRYSNARRERGRYPRKFIVDSQGDMALWLIRQMDVLSVKHKIPVTDMCLLFRLNENLDWVVAEFTKRRILKEKVPQMMTIHGSKGLEFPVVFLCDMEESQLPNYRRKNTAAARTWTELFLRVFNRKKTVPDFDIQEEKRLFYVGVTRAREFLFLVSCREKLHNGRTVKFVPSRFMDLI